MTKVMNCSCQNEWQDGKYGKGKRVFNSTAKKDPQHYRCTVCSTVKTSGGDAQAKPKKK